MRLLFNFLLLSTLTIIATSLIFISINTVFAHQSTQETTQITSPQITSESTNPDKPEDKPLPDTLHPTVAEKADILIARAEEKDITVQITDGFRTHEEQEALYAQGRTEPGDIVTNARGGESYHNYGLAVDFAIEADGEVIWDVTYDGNDNGMSDWEEVAEIAKDLGFEWGGDWEEFKDYPHLQMDFDTSIRDLQRGNHDIF